MAKQRSRDEDPGHHTIPSQTQLWNDDVTGLLTTKARTNSQQFFKYIFR